MKSNSKRTQRDYSLAFKLAVVDKLKKANSHINKHKTTTEFRGVQRF